MKILILNTVCGIGSTGRICTDLYDELTKKGHETCIAFGRGEASKKYNTYKIGNRLDNYLHVFETRLFDNHGFSSRKATKKFVEFLREYDADIIHFHNLHGYYLNIKILLEYINKEFKGKVIITLHDTWLFSGHSASIEDPNYRGSRNDLKSYPKTFFFNFYKKNLEKKMNLFTPISDESITIVTPSEWLKKMSENTYLNKFEISVINNGVDQSIFKPRVEELEKTKPKIILAVTNIWSKEKGIDVVNWIAEQKEAEKFQVVLIGRVNKKYNLSSNLIHINQTSSIQELSKYYSDASVFINPTFKDNFPTTNLEALSSGIPVVTFDTGGSGEVIAEKKHGKVVPKGNKKLLLSSILDYIEQNNNIEISSYAKKFSKKNMIKEYIDLYEKIDKKTY